MKYMGEGGGEGSVLKWTVSRNCVIMYLLHGMRMHESKVLRKIL
jgi:hypothetical protein